MRNTYFISFQKRMIRLEFAIPAASKQEARTIAEKEIARLRGYRYQGVN
jgi:hypothetical protein